MRTVAEAHMGETVAWANPEPRSVPHLVTSVPGPNSKELHDRIARHQPLLQVEALHPIVFKSASGVSLTDVDGNRYLDLSSGTTITNLGHAHPKVAEAIAEAARTADNVHVWGTRWKAEALEALADVTPPGINTFSFFTTGSEAVEGALRVARAATGRYGFASPHGDFHGRTDGSASITAARYWNALRESGSYLFPSGCRTSQPEPCDLSCAERGAESLAQNLSGQLAGVVMEIVQNYNGSYAYKPGYVARIAEIAREQAGLFIADEVGTGFGRTGAWFASDHENVVPDVMVLGKGMGNGFPVSVVAVRDEYREALHDSFPSSSLGGNPMATAVVATVIQVMQEEDIISYAAEIGQFALQELEAIRDRHPLVSEINGRGMLYSLHLDREKLGEGVGELGLYPATMEIYSEIIKRGVFLSANENNFRIRPPLVISRENFAKGLAIVEESIASVEKRLGLAF